MKEGICQMGKGPHKDDTGVASQFLIKKWRSNSNNNNNNSNVAGFGIL